MILPLCRQKADSCTAKTKEKGKDSTSALYGCRGINYNNLLHPICKKWYCTFPLPLPHNAEQKAWINASLNSKHQLPISNWLLGAPQAKLHTLIRILPPPNSGTEQPFSGSCLQEHQNVQFHCRYCINLIAMLL